MTKEPVLAAHTKRRIARLDYAIRAINGGKLPVFKMFLAGLYIGEVSPYDGTPESGFEIVHRQALQAGRNAKVHMRLVLVEGTADGINKTVPMFYQDQTEWTQEGW